MNLEDFVGNRLSEEEKKYRLKELNKLIEENEIDEEMLPYLDVMNSIDGVVSTQCCCGHNNKELKAYIDFRCSAEPEIVIDLILRPIEDKFGCNIQLMTEHNRLRYCIWMNNAEWEDEMKYLIQLLGGL